MLSLLTPAAPPKATTGAAPDAAQPSGRADESPDAAGSFARALQDSSAALQKSDASAGQTGTADAADAADTDNNAAAPRSSRRAATDRLRAMGLGGGTPPGMDPSIHTGTGRTAAKATRGGLPGAGDDRDPAESTAAAAAAAAAATVACALPPTDAAAPFTVFVPTVATPDGPAQDAPLVPITDAGSPATAQGPSPGAAAVLPLPGTAEAGPASAAASAAAAAVATSNAARPGPARPGPESDTAAVGAGGLETTAATTPAADSSGIERAQPEGASPVPHPATPSVPAQPGATAIPIPAATVAATTASATAATSPAAPARTDAARRPLAATARATTEPARGAAGESRRTAGRADAAAESASTSSASPMALPAQPSAVTEPRAARPTTAEPGRSGPRDNAIERAGTEAGGAAVPSSAASAAPSATALLPRFADHLQAALPAAPVTGMHAAEGSSATATAHAQLPAPLQSPEFPPALGAQISLFARNGVERATIEINPPEMGPISVQIALDGSGARVDFLADAAATRQVIEAALPTLASSLREAGLTLTGGGVFQQPQSSAGFAGQGSGQPGHGQGQGGRPGVPTDDGLGAAGQTTVLRTSAQRGLVDLVA